MGTDQNQDGMKRRMWLAPERRPCSGQVGRPQETPAGPGLPHRVCRELPEVRPAGRSGLPGLLPRPERHTFDVPVIDAPMTSDLFSKDKPDREGNEGSNGETIGLRVKRSRNVLIG